MLLMIVCLLAAALLALAVCWLSWHSSPVEQQPDEWWK